jgi:hypothetical protein
MAKNVIDAVRRRRAAQANRQTETRAATVGRSVLGFRKTYSQDEWNRIEAEREAMRERLTAED